MSDETLYLVHYSRDAEWGTKKEWEIKWEDDNGINLNGKYYPRYFKSVYCWNLNSDNSYLVINKEYPDLIIDDYGNIKVKGE
ncbi:hypothetical protein [Spiroplasma phoeniceum]|uniref:Uncharacterized protein n=1 Tax=Spiroplasma phoeniceum P40 TaxID=1276259 RepID=A0A345DQG5_9MOLU|nr:hypothetical protein [Spiroplasma phoeniceum]AXF96456.1 hypothetical protein SDAV_001489 [Spiroplasma phoeniceum P40]